MVLVLNAKVTTLVLAIKGNVVVDSEIYICCFKSYAILIAEGYLLRIVNHNVDFVSELELILVWVSIYFSAAMNWLVMLVQTNFWSIQL